MPKVDRQQHTFQVGKICHLLVAWGCSLSLWKECLSITYSFHNARVIEHEKCEVKPYCLRSSISLAVSPAISFMERRMSSLSLGSSHRSAMRLASARSALMFSSPSGPP